VHAMVAGDASDARQGKRAGERVGKMEELTTNPFVRSIWAEEDRGSGSTKKGWSSDGAPMEVDGGGPIPAGKSSGEAHGGVEKVRGVVGRALMEGIDERQPEMAGAPT